MKRYFISNNKPLLKPFGRWAIAVVAVIALSLCGVAFRLMTQFQQGSATASGSTPSSSRTGAVSALGRLYPEGEVVRLSAPTALNGVGSNRVAKLLVNEGDRVKQGQIIAVLDNHQNLEAAKKLADEDVKVATAKLEKIKAGAKSGELQAQSATVTQLEAELRGQLVAQNNTIERLKAGFSNSEMDHNRHQQLFQEGAVTASQLDNKRLQMITAQEQLNEAQAGRERTKATLQQQIKTAQATLNQLAEVRPTDVQAVQAEVNRAMANVKKAQAELDLAYIRAPIDGQVLKIHTRPGEMVDSKGIAAIGRTDQMNVIAEVYELDINRVQVGQRATITSKVFPDKLQGTVSEVGLQVNPQGVASTDPTANVNNRIIEVKIRLDSIDNQKIAALTNLQVDVKIEP
jgi:HlyD family secretion protein